MNWDAEHARAAITLMGEHEKTLITRIAEARGRRVPVSELSATLGMPASTALPQDFPALNAYVDKCKAENVALELPVSDSGATDGDGWYWMSPDVSEGVFLRVLSAMREPSGAGSEQQARAAE